MKLKMSSWDCGGRAIEIIAFRFQLEENNTVERLRKNEKVGVYGEHSNVTMGGLTMKTLPPASLIVCMYCQDDSELF